MTPEYAPREGSIPHKVIEHLKRLEPEAMITSAEIVELFNAGAGMSTQLRKCVDAGLLVAQRSGRSMAYSLPPPTEPSDGKLVIASWSDGDVMVRGGQAGDDGSVVYTREQMDQLVKHVTQPHIPVA